MTSCQSCGKLIASGTAESLCRACREAAWEAMYGSRKPDASTQVAPSESAVAAPYDDAVCVRCRRHPAIDDSDFCLGCHLELIAALGDAAEDVVLAPPEPPKPPVASPVTLMSDIEDKRDRTATSHIRVVGGVKIK